MLNQDLKLRNESGGIGVNVLVKQVESSSAWEKNVDFDGGYFLQVRSVWWFRVRKNGHLYLKKGILVCLAMDGVEVLASGFEMDEEAEIEKLVASMGRVLQTKTSVDVSFVIAKNILAAKYKWASNVLKKPVVTIDWLYQFHNEHCVVPLEPYRVLPFSGSTICVTGIPTDAQKEI